MPSVMTFNELRDEAALLLAFPLIQVLRPRLTDASSYLAQIKRQQQQNYCLIGGFVAGELVGLVGYRQQENLLYGQFLYVDDLVVAPAQQAMGHGAQLLDFARQQAKQLGCQHLVLDTGLHKALAQRFYFRCGLLAKGMHFTEALTEQ
ncbi:GNAT family N-acetyltransferase [Neisseriaceae bacterium TC5R-5]|nr:GNAT family N-acetyltransferase [Neisseriaceae bacterium TC5R-5]